MSEGTSYHTEAAVMPPKWMELLRLLKHRLSLLVVFSAVFAYFYADVPVDWKVFTWMCVGGFLITAGANVINQILEKDSDALMHRTKTRPLPIGSIEVGEAWAYAAALCGSGLLMLYWISVPMLWLGVLSVVSYAFLYTPLKKVTPWAVFIGAFPGSMPVLMGYVAATGDFTQEAGLIFMFQFVWQFPHFWAIGWLGDDEYRKAGIRLLPSREGRTGFTLFLILVFTLLTIMCSFSLWMAELANIWLVIGGGILGLGFYIYAWRLYQTQSLPDARKLMLASVIYLPLMMILMLLTKL